MADDEQRTHRITPGPNQRMRVVLRTQTVHDVVEVRVGPSWVTFVKNSVRYDVPVQAVEAIVTAPLEARGSSDATSHYGQHPNCTVCEAIGRSGVGIP